MTHETNFSVGLSDIPVNRAQLDSVASFSPDPEEGYQLIRGFLSIRQAALRDAIVKIVTQLSRRDPFAAPAPVEKDDGVRSAGHAMLLEPVSGNPDQSSTVVG